MDEQDNMPSSINPPPILTTSTSSQNYLLPTDYHQNVEKTSLSKNPNEMQLQLLKRVKAEKLKEQEIDSMAQFRHFSYKVMVIT